MREASGEIGSIRSRVRDASTEVGSIKSRVHMLEEAWLREKESKKK